MNRLFEIQTLSERQAGLRDYIRLEDPVTILTGGYALISSLFPNIFGGSRKKLTQSNWIEMFPGNGYWTTKLRDYLSKHIDYDVDMKNVTEFTNYFVYDNRFTLYPAYQPGDFQKAFAIFSENLRKEAVTGGNQPVGNYPGGIGAIDWQTLLLVGGGAVLLIALMNKKKTRKK